MPVQADRRTRSDQQDIVRKQDLEAIIKAGDAEKLIQAARKLAERLRTDDLSSAQIRGVFMNLRQIEMRWAESEGQSKPSAAKTEEETKAEAEEKAKAKAKDAQRQLLLLIPKLEYQRKRNRGVSQLKAALEPAIRMVGTDRDRFIHLVEFMEAVVAYHK